MPSKRRRVSSQPRSRKTVVAGTTFMARTRQRTRWTGSIPTGKNTSPGRAQHWCRALSMQGAAFRPKRLLRRTGSCEGISFAQEGTEPVHPDAANVRPPRTSAQKARRSRFPAASAHGRRIRPSPRSRTSTTSAVRSGASDLTCRSTSRSDPRMALVARLWPGWGWNLTSLAIAARNRSRSASVDGVNRARARSMFSDIAEAVSRSEPAAFHAKRHSARRGPRSREPVKAGAKLHLYGQG